MNYFTEQFGNCTLVSDAEKLRNVRDSHIVSVGGDGTLHVAINYADLESNTFSCMAMGSGNDFVTAFPKHGIEILCFRIKQNNWEYLDIIKADEIYVHNICGVGFEALVAKKAHEKKRKITALKYVIPVLKNLFTYKPINAKIVAESYEYHDKVLIASLGNGKRAGGGFRLFPKASLTDGKMDLLLIKPCNFFQKIIYLVLANFGKHLKLKTVDYVQVESCNIALEKTGWFDADGDVYNKKEIEVRVIQGMFKVIQ